jgi:hypothetical protein
MRLIAGGLSAVSRRLVLELIEVAAPLVWNGTRIVEIGFVEFFYVGRIGPEKIGG